MLAIVRYLEEWDAKLREVQSFEIHTDHKNLEYFITVRKLTERQMRWSLILSRYNFVIVHIPDKENKRADALSRKDQDLPANTDDQRLTDRNIQLLKPEMLAKYPVVQVAPVQTSPRQGEGVAEERQSSTQVRTLPDKLTDWEAAVTDDSEY
jgi:hypothetical protein